MKKFFSWSAWSITTKIMVLFLGLSVISMGVIGYIALTNIQELGQYALNSSTSLGETAIKDSTAALTKLGEDTMSQIAMDVGKQVEMYLKSHPGMTPLEMRKDQEFRNIVVQPVGKTGYTTLIDPNNDTIIIHKFPGQEKGLSPLRGTLPTFWTLLESSGQGQPTGGYYDWQEVDGSINQKYAGIYPINDDGKILTLWATTYINEFSTPAEETEKEINKAILNSSNYISDNITKTQNSFAIIFAVLVNVVIGLALLLSRVITNPIMALKRGAEEIGIGRLDYRIDVTGRDELGDLAKTFNKMGSALKSNMEELKSTAVENIAQERRIQENLRLYAQKVSEAQEAERKRVARELHDDTAQALVVVLRQLDDLAAERPSLSAKEIREEVRKILEGVRHFSQELRPSILDDLGLIPAVKWLASDLNKTYGIKVETQIWGRQRQLSPEAELMLFRIAQEALTNIRKHSQATLVSINIEFTDQSVKVIIQDNGKGFETPSRLGDLPKKGKLGLTGMEERAQLLGGSLQIESHPGQGTTVTVEVPL
jgi:two-component system, NarL family, sensor histidine kinase DegS